YSAAPLDDDHGAAVVEDSVVADHDSVAWREGAYETAALLIGVVVRDWDGDTRLARLFSQRGTSPVETAQAAAVAGHDPADRAGSPPPAARCHVVGRRQEQEGVDQHNGNDQHSGAGEEPAGQPSRPRRPGTWCLPGRPEAPSQEPHSIVHFHRPR